MADLDLSFVDETVQRLGRQPETVIPILQAIQAHYRYVPREALKRVCEISKITPGAITGVSTFYTQFRHRPVGRHMISVCHGTACHVKGAGLVQDALERQLGIGGGMPNPRKLSEASAIIAAPMAMVNMMMTGANTLGRRCRISIRAFEAPMAVAAST